MELLQLMEEEVFLELVVRVLVVTEADVLRSKQ
jgi:hypothetical protein